MRLLFVAVAVLALSPAGPSIATELLKRPSRVTAPQTIPASHGRFSGSVKDPLGKPATDILAKDTAFSKDARPRPAPFEFDATLRGSINGVDDSHAAKPAPFGASSQERR